MSNHASVLPSAAGRLAPTLRMSSAVQLPERRRWNRERAFAPVYIACDEHVVAARVVNMSIDGALLEVRSADSLDFGKLIVHFADRTQVRIDLRWHRVGHLGVRWSDAHTNVLERLHLEHLGREHLNYLIAWQRHNVAHARRQSMRLTLDGSQRDIVLPAAGLVGER